jgi:Polysaccharide deacetylase
VKMLASSLARKSIKAALLPIDLLHPRRPGDVVILLYHRIGDGTREIDLPARVFERHLIDLIQQRRLRSLEEALSDDQGGVVLTFDDGYRDFHDQVLPLLVRHEVPALLYLATGLVANNNSSMVATDTALTWPMLRDALATELVTIGAHTHSHANLSKATDAEALAEMRRAKELIEDRLGVACRHFAYPWSVGSPGADRAARRLFDTAALHGWKTNRKGERDLHRLGRMPILRSDGGLFFRAKSRGLLNSEALAYRVLRRGPWGKM